MLLEPKAISVIVFMLLLLLSNIVCISETVSEELFYYQCNPPNPKIKFRSDVRADKTIFIEVSNNLLSQVISRAFAILLKEVYGYRNIYLYELEYNLTHSAIYEDYKLEMSREYLKTDTEARMNLGVWTPPGSHNPPPEIRQIGELWMGRFGLFAPKFSPDEFSTMISYSFLEDNQSQMFQRYLLKSRLSNDIKSLADNNCHNGYREVKDCYYSPPQCEKDTCITVLSSDFNETSFIIDHISDLNLCINVVWLGNKLSYVMQYLLETEHKFIILHWTPSEIIINNKTEYQIIAMPQCELLTNTDVPCVYELTPILKLVSPKLYSTMEPIIWSLNTPIGYNDLKYIFNLSNERTKAFSLDSLRTVEGYLNTRVIYSAHDRYFTHTMSRQNLFNEIACSWYNWSNSSINAAIQTARSKDKTIISIGGMFPESITYSGLEIAANMAIDAVTTSNILGNIKFDMLINNGDCKSDAVMKNFVNFYTKSDRVIGVLGPACSETVEPIAGVSKHFRMPVVSYSAEGASFTDRTQYPYFFRTIGGNRQYEHVYVRLLKKMGWHRVAALTEDGQRYTEYISHMETLLIENGIELIANKKFPREATPDAIRECLSYLKLERAKIIIADIYNEQAWIVMCEAFKLEMTSEQDYVWFLPAWLPKLWNNNEHRKVNVSCTEDEIQQIINGHFSLSHVPYAPDDTILSKENRTVRQWKRALLRKAKHQTSADLNILSTYSGYAYDAVWVYALALKKLIDIDAKYLMDLHSVETTKKFVQIISAIDFIGASGRILFGEGGTRFTNVNVIQWVGNTSYLVGVFEPNISFNIDMQKRQIIGGDLYWNSSRVFWFHDRIPSDGTVICSVNYLAKLLNIECHTAIYMLTIFVLLALVVLITLASFIFWKRKFDKKLEHSAKVMRNFGIDLLSPSTVPINTLDKWEVPKDRIVINRRLGEGAFGTVYGGEAQIDESSWTAVAVKTLKKGSSREDRLDFLSEAEAMKRFDHTNVVKLLGVCLQNEPLYAIMEFMLYGDLKTFLLARRHLVGKKLSDDSDVSPKRLTVMALDIVRALSYLADMKYVHRDVACRNCLVNAQRVVKLGDFGMARPMFESDYYKFNRKGMLPVRWMAPESLLLGIFSPASDVWSFGVLLYEMITFGSFPYQGLTNNQVLDHLKNSKTLVIPSGVKPQLEGLMNACWNPCYKKRPTATEVVEFIGNYPRLIVPCLDVPLASVQIPETDSDEMELLPGLRKHSPEQFAQISMCKSSLDRTHSTLPNEITLREFNVSYENEDLSIPLHAYNPNEPLLQPNTEISSNSLTRRYVPMCGLKRSNSAVENTSVI